MTLLFNFLKRTLLKPQITQGGKSKSLEYYVTNISIIAMYHPTHLCLSKLVIKRSENLHTFILPLISLPNLQSSFLCLEKGNIKSMVPSNLHLIYYCKTVFENIEDCHIEKVNMY